MEQTAEQRVKAKWPRCYSQQAKDGEWGIVNVNGYLPNSLRLEMLGRSRESELAAWESAASRIEFKEATR